MKGETLTRFRNSATYAQLLTFDHLQQEYSKGNVTYEEVQLFIVFCTATVVKNERIKRLLT